jgi:hypothetical protein
MNVMKTICGDLKDADGHMVNMAQNSKTAISRNTLPRKYFRKKYRWHLKIQLSRDELSSMIGTATESCIRLYQTLKKVVL